MVCGRHVSFAFLSHACDRAHCNVSCGFPVVLCTGNVYFRGATLMQRVLGSGTSLAYTDATAVNVSTLLATARTPTDTVESSVEQYATPKCSPVILWSHNRIECFVIPERAPEVLTACVAAIAGVKGTSRCLGGGSCRIQ